MRGPQTATEMRREDARNFLEGLKAHLKEKIGTPDEVRRKMQEFVADYKRKKQNAQDAPHEGLFVDNFVLPSIHEYLTAALRLSSADVRKAFLAESDDARKKEMTSGTPASPFQKQFIAANSLVRTWWNSTSKSPVHQSCPDFAFRLPCPYSVVGEVKYFRGGQLDAAKTEPVKGVYQGFYYRGLPRVPESKHPAWDYEYACLLAYDASENCSLVKAWDKVDARVKSACWNGTNVFVMVLP